MLTQLPFITINQEMSLYFDSAFTVEAFEKNCGD